MLNDRKYVLARAPMRVSFVGGGTDFPEFWENGREGHVISAAINLYNYVELKDMFDTNVRVHHSEIETEPVASRIKHSYARTALENHALFRGTEIVITSDVMTTGSGLGASSSLMSALIYACREFQGKPALANEDLAREIYRLEHEAGTVGGYQDQYAIAYGGLNSITFSEKRVAVTPVKLSSETKDAFSSRLFLVYSNLARRESDMQKGHQEKIKENRKANYLDDLVKLSYQFQDELTKSNPDFNILGQILHEGWEMKKEFNRDVTNVYIDELYEKLRGAGVIGGKILGAGGGGFILALAKEGAKKSIMYSLYPNFIALDFSFVDTPPCVVWKNV